MALQPVEMKLGDNTWGGIAETSTDWMLGPVFPSVDVAAAFLDYHKGGRSLRLMNDNDLDQQRWLFLQPIRCENEPCAHDTKDGYTGKVRMYRVTLGEYEKETVMALCDECVKSLNARYDASIAKETANSAAGIDDGDYSDSYINVVEIDGIDD